MASNYCSLWRRMPTSSQRASWPRPSPPRSRSCRLMEFPFMACLYIDCILMHVMRANPALLNSITCPTSSHTLLEHANASHQSFTGASSGQIFNTPMRIATIGRVDGNCTSRLRGESRVPEIGPRVVLKGSSGLYVSFAVRRNYHRQRGIPTIRPQSIQIQRALD